VATLEADAVALQAWTDISGKNHRLVAMEEDAVLSVPRDGAREHYPFDVAA
jgi:hypothetical protein